MTPDPSGHHHKHARHVLEQEEHAHRAREGNSDRAVCLSALWT